MGADRGGGRHPGHPPPPLDHDVGFLTLGPKLDPLYHPTPSFKKNFFPPRLIAHPWNILTQTGKPSENKRREHYPWPLSVDMWSGHSIWLHDFTKAHFTKEQHSTKRTCMLCRTASWWAMYMYVNLSVINMSVIKLTLSAISHVHLANPWQNMSKVAHSLYMSTDDNDQ